MYICNKIALSKCTTNEENNLILLRYFRNFKRDDLPGSLFDFSTFNNPSFGHKSQPNYRFSICFDRFICNSQNYEKIKSFGFVNFDCFNEFNLDQYFDRFILRDSFGSHLFWRNWNDYRTFD